MAAFDWAVNLAKQLINANGEAVTLTLYATSAPDGNFPNETQPSVPFNDSARAVFLNYSTKEAGTTYGDGNEIHRDDKKVLVAADGLEFDPNLQGTITRADGLMFRIVKVKCLDPGNQKIYFELQVRR